MDFSFAGTAGTSQNTTKPKLTGNNIYDVTFDGCEIQDIAGVKDATATYRVLKFKFSNDEGTFEHTVFEPRPEDFERKETDSTSKDGKKNKILQPSGVESMMLLFKHIIDAVNPTLAQQIDSKEKNLGAKDWETLRILVKKSVDTGKGISTRIKLLKNKSGDAIFPGFFAALTKEKVAYIRNNFIGEKVSFSSYEVERIKNEANAKPSRVEAFVPTKEDDDDLDTINFNVEGL